MYLVLNTIPMAKSHLEAVPVSRIAANGWGKGELFALFFIVWGILFKAEV